MSLDNVKLSIKNLDLFYGDNQALKNINIDIKENKVTALIGPSGCGKSTFLRTLNRMNDLIENVTIKGKIEVDGEDIYQTEDVIKLRTKVGMVFQKPNPFPMSIYDNIAYGPRTHGIHSKSKLDEIVANFPKDLEDDIEHDEIRIAVIGRPNVGKSSLVNALLGQERVIVSDVAGTTRDAIDTKFDDGNTHFTLIDTAGMRRKGKIDMPIERYSVMRSLRAVDRADVVLMVISAPEGVTEQDKKIAGYAHESGKGCIIVVNKWDLIEKDDKTSLRFTEDIRDELGFLQYAPVLYTSALTKQRVHRVVDLVKYVAEQQAMRVQTSVLNQLVMDAVSINPPPSHKGKQLKIYFMTQADIKPPKFLVFVNDPELMHFSYLRFLENKLRESFGFEGTPLKLVVRGRKEEDDE